MSGIITSRRMASGSAESASAVPAAPPLAVHTVQVSVNWRLSFATSRMSFSSSITRICLCGMLPVLFCNRDRELKAAAGGIVLFHPDAAAVRGHDALADGQPEARAAFVA